MHAVNLKQGMKVTYRVSGSRKDTRISIATVASVSVADNRVSLHRRDGNSVTKITIPAARVVSVLDAE